MTDDLEDAGEEVVLTVTATLDILPPYAAVLTVHDPNDGPRHATLHYLPTVTEEQLQRLAVWAGEKVQRFIDHGYDGTWEWDAPDENLDMAFTAYVRPEDL